MAVGLSALSAGRALHLGRFMILVSVRGSVGPTAFVPYEVEQLKTTVTSSATEYATFRLVA
jgi:hypothetical protein